MDSAANVARRTGQCRRLETQGVPAGFLLSRLRIILAGGGGSPASRAPHDLAVLKPSRRERSADSSRHWARNGASADRHSMHKGSSVGPHSMRVGAGARHHSQILSADCGRVRCAVVFGARHTSSGGACQTTSHALGCAADIHTSLQSREPRRLAPLAAQRSASHRKRHQPARVGQPIPHKPRGPGVGASWREGAPIA